METKTAKITSVHENQRSYDYQGTKYFVHHIKFEGSDNTWNYDSKTQTCEKFKSGEVATFDTNVIEKNGFTNYKIKPKQDANGGGFKKGEPKDQGIITYLSVLSSASNFYASKPQATNAEVFEMAEQAFNKAIQKSTLNK